MHTCILHSYLHTYVHTYIHIHTEAYIHYTYIFSFLFLFHQLAHSEALIMLLQTSLFLVFPYSVDNWMPLSSKSSRTCMHAYTYIHHIHTYIHTYMHTWIHTCTYTDIHACMHYIHTNIHVIHVYMDTCIYLPTYPTRMHTLTDLLLWFYEEIQRLRSPPQTDVRPVNDKIVISRCSCRFNSTTLCDNTMH